MSDITSSLFPGQPRHQMSISDLDAAFEAFSKPMRDIVNANDLEFDRFSKLGVEDQLAQLGNGRRDPVDEMLDELGKRSEIPRQGNPKRNDDSELKTGKEIVKPIQENAKAALTGLTWNPAKGCFTSNSEAGRKADARKAAIDNGDNVYEYVGGAECYIQRDGSLYVENKKSITSKIIDQSDSTNDTLEDEEKFTPYILENNGEEWVNAEGALPFDETKILAKAGFKGEINADGTVKCGAKSRVAIQSDGPLYDLTTNEYYEETTNTWIKDPAYAATPDINKTKRTDTTAIMDAKGINFMPNPVDGSYAYNVKKGKLFTQKDGSICQLGFGGLQPRVFSRNKAGIITESNKPLFQTSSLIPKSGITARFSNVKSYPVWTYTDPVDKTKYYVRFNDESGIIIAEKSGRDVKSTKVFTKDGWMSGENYENSHGKIPPPTKDAMGPSASSTPTSSTTPSSPTPPPSRRSGAALPL